MTTDEIVDYLRDALKGELGHRSDLDAVDDGPDGSLVIGAGGERLTLHIRHAGQSALDVWPGKIREDETLDEQRARLDEMLADGEASAEAYGPVPPEEVHRMVEEAKASGLRTREQQLQNEARRRRAG